MFIYKLNVAQPLAAWLLLREDGASACATLITARHAACATLIAAHHAACATLIAARYALNIYEKIGRNA